MYNCYISSTLRTNRFQTLWQTVRQNSIAYLNGPAEATFTIKLVFDFFRSIPFAELSIEVLKTYINMLYICSELIDKLRFSHDRGSTDKHSARKKYRILSRSQIFKYLRQNQFIEIFNSCTRKAR